MVCLFYLQVVGESDGCYCISDLLFSAYYWIASVLHTSIGHAWQGEMATQKQPRPTLHTAQLARAEQRYDNFVEHSVFLELQKLTSTSAME